MLAAAALFLAGCLATPQTEAATVGLAAPFEGAQRDLGYEVLAAAKIAIAEQNAAGGWSGRPIALAALNDEGEPAQAIVVARQFALDPSVSGVVGHWSRETTDAALPIYQDAGIRLMIPSAGDSSVPSESVRRIAPDDKEVIAALLDYLSESGVGKSIALSIEPDSLAVVVEGALRAAGFSVAADDGPADILVLALDDEATARAMANSTSALVALLNGPYLPSLDKLQPLDDSVVTWVVSGEWAGPIFDATFRDVTGHSPSPQAELAYMATKALLQASAGGARSPLSVRFMPARSVLAR